MNTADTHYGLVHCHLFNAMDLMAESMCQSQIQEWVERRSTYTVDLIIVCQFNLLTEVLIDLLTPSSKSPHLTCSRRTTSRPRAAALSC